MNIIMLGGNTKESIEKRLQIVASAGMLSRSDGTVSDVYESRDNYEKNVKVVQNILGLGHKSIADHDYIVLGLEDVSAIVEQTLISYRLTSFTIKSRRNVDFRNVGFYVPEFKNNNNDILNNNQKLKEEYQTYMKSLFNKYGDLVDEGLPIEDCRYILPYPYHSNIIMGCDAHEFLNMTSDLLYGKNSNITELKELGEKFSNIIDEYIPYLKKNLEQEQDKSYYEDKFKFIDEIIDKSKENTLPLNRGIELEKCKLLEKVHMTSSTKNADYKVAASVLQNRYQISQEEAEYLLWDLSKYDRFIVKNIVDGVLKSKNQRELEQVVYSFELPISLAVLTHLTRHRMHSLLIPDFVPIWNLENYVTPKSLKENHESDYKEIFANNKLMYEYFKSQEVRDEDLVYFYLSGNACNVQTTMNARTLRWISKMRCCNKAQWEIRDLVNEMVRQAQNVTPLLAKGYGPTCQVEGYCPEGKDSCKNRGVVTKKLEKK